MFDYRVSKHAHFEDSYNLATGKYTCSSEHVHSLRRTSR